MRPFVCRTEIEMESIDFNESSVSGHAPKIEKFKPKKSRKLRNKERKEQLLLERKLKRLTLDIDGSKEKRMHKKRVKKEVSNNKPHSGINASNPFGKPVISNIEEIKTKSDPSIQTNYNTNRYNDCEFRFNQSNSELSVIDQMRPIYNDEDQQSGNSNLENINIQNTHKASRKFKKNKAQKKKKSQKRILKKIVKRKERAMARLSEKTINLEMANALKKMKI
ncbi:hypothetical protein BLOT_012421 [Blomia tropicalis]|nr:hypothetical protein BLOT_012421 [Blomia tropicalis]